MVCVCFVEVSQTLENDRPEHSKGVQSPIFPGLFVICFMAMLSSNEKVFAKTQIHLARLRSGQELANAKFCHVSGNQ